MKNFLKSLLPTTYQYSRWSMPSKYAFWGLLIGLVALALTIEGRANPAPNIDQIRGAVNISLGPLLQKTQILSFGEIEKLIGNSAISLRPSGGSEKLTNDELAAGFEKYVGPHRDNWPLFYRAEAALKVLQWKSPREVLESFDRGLDLAPSDLALLYDRARFLVFDTQIANAKIEFEKIKKALLNLPPQHYPNQFSVELALANYDYISKKYLEALPTYELALSNLEGTEDVTSYDILIFQPLIAPLEGLFIVSNRGKLAELIIRLRVGEIYGLLGRHTDAMNQLEAVLELKKKPELKKRTAFMSDSRLFLDLAFMNAYSGNVDRAIELANTIIQLQPAYVLGFSEPSDFYLKALVVKGVAFSRQGHSKKALAYFDRYLTSTEGKAPESVDSTYYAMAIASVVSIHSVCGSPEQGLEYLSKLAERYRTASLEPGVQMELAVATANMYYHLGDAENFRKTISVTYEIRQRLPQTNFVTDAILFWVEARYFESEGRLHEAISFEDKALKVLDEVDSSQAADLRESIMSARQRRSIANSKK